MIEKRQACRALLISPNQEILLMKVEDPNTGWSAWITPGGGLFQGESQHEGLVRELREELDYYIDTINIGPEVWQRFHAFTWEDKKIEQSESYFLIKTRFFVPGSCENME